jgi:hypothetical protein
MATQNAWIYESSQTTDAPLGYTYEERREVLSAWGFSCRCSLCTASREERDMSDARRERILEIYRSLRQPLELGHERVGQLIKEATRLIELEELHPQLVQYYPQFAKAYIMLGDLERARYFVKEADILWKFYGGEEHENIEGMRDLWMQLKEAEEEQQNEG